jgi:thymidylate synthase (FAD)
MKVIKQHWDWAATMEPEAALGMIEDAGRTCYQSESKGDPAEFVRKIIKRGHESVLEHVSLSVRIVTDRGVTHELVRHRLAAYSQESTRYCCYNDEIGVILPVEFYDIHGKEITEETTTAERQAHLPYRLWRGAMLEAEESYLAMLAQKAPPQLARSVLPNSLKTEIVMSANLREFRHVFRLRTSKAAHPQIHALMRDMLTVFKRQIPVVFEDINPEE